MGMFYPFSNDPTVKLLGVEAGGDGVDTKRHSATLVGGSKGVLHGVRTYILQDEHGQINDTHSISAGLDYPGVGPELSSWKDTERAKFIAATDAEALIGFRTLSELFFDFRQGPGGQLRGSFPHLRHRMPSTVLWNWQRQWTRTRTLSFV